MTGSKYHNADRKACTTTETSLDFGRFQVLLRRRRLLGADGAPIGLGARAFEILLALLEADGRLVTKEQLMARVWPGVTVGEGNLKAQVCALRKVLGEDRDLVHSEHGRGYRFTGVIRSNSERDGFQDPMPLRSWPTREVFPPRSARLASEGWSFRDRTGKHFDSVRDAEAASRRD